MFRAANFLSLLLVCAAATPLVAESITYTFEGVVEIPSPFLGDRFLVGELVTGSFTYNAVATDLAPGDATLGNYLSSVESFIFQIGDYVGTMKIPVPGDIQVIDRDVIAPLPRPHRDSYTVVSLVSGQPVEGYDLLLGALQILDLDGDALTSDVITPPALDLFSDPLITIDFAPQGSEQNRVWASLTRLEPVPEPSGAMLGLLAALLICVRRPNQR